MSINVVSLFSGGGGLDLGFKTYNPSNETNKKWFRDYNFNHAILNIGINYPF